MSKVVYNKSVGGFCLSPKAVAWLSERGLNVDEWGDEIEHNLGLVPRHHPLLIECVETLKEEAGDESELAIYEIEGFQYHIVDYDGAETVHTPENTKWVEVD